MSGNDFAVTKVEVTKNEGSSGAKNRYKRYYCFLNFYNIFLKISRFHPSQIVSDGNVMLIIISLLLLIIKSNDDIIFEEMLIR